ncbi:MAG TPA: tetratricopeptide repeat protein [Planctomycetes bacterium]|nr:tetratricopeptide repeat protein [Planctomycetota bacterium]
MKPRERLVLLVLVLAVFALHGRELGFEFLSYDDGDYVVHNPFVRDGLSVRSIAWAFGAFHSANWHPVTWLSHQLDCSLFGPDPAGHHAVNVAVAALATAVLYRFLLRSTGRLLPSAFVAAAWALHPLRVSSIAWVSERKDLLAALFLFLSLEQWARYGTTGARKRYGLALAFFALGLASKPSLIPVPVLLLLIDVWPLGRTRGREPVPTKRLLLEKLPFLALSLASIALTLGAQSAGGTVSSLAELPLDARIGQAVRSIALYPLQSLAPSSLAFFHPHPALVDPDWAPFGPGFFGALVFLIAVTAIALRARRARPSLLVGWLAYLVMLAPAVGLVQVGEQAWAERYASLSTLWLFAGVAFLGVRARVLPWLAGLLIVSWAALAWREIPNWRDSRALARRALEVTDRNYTAEAILAKTFFEEGRYDDARVHYERAVAIRPRFSEALFGLGLVAQNEGRLAEAIRFYRSALVAQPDRAETWLNLGAVLGTRGDLSEAVDAFGRALALADSAPEAAAAARGNLEGMRDRLRVAPAGDPEARALLRRVEAALGAP